MAYSVARFGGSDGDRANVLDQGMPIQVSTNVFVHPHSCTHCDKLQLDFDSPESRRWLQERYSIHLGLSIVECKRAADDGCDLFAWLLKSLVLHPSVIPNIRADWPLVASVGESRNQIQLGFANMVAAMCCVSESTGLEVAGQARLLQSSARATPLIWTCQMPKQVISSPSDPSRDFVDDELIITTKRTQKRFTFPEL
jgi:hypothetical protein